MAKNLSPEMMALISSRNPTLAPCIQIVSREGEALGFTSHDRDILIDGVLYSAKNGASIPQLDNRSELEVGNTNLEILLSDDRITEIDLLGGRWDGAIVRYFLVDYNAPPVSLSASPRQYIPMGGLYTIGSVEIDSGDRFTAEVRGLISRLTKDNGDTTNRGCRYEFGDSRCTKDLTTLTHALAITEVYPDIPLRFQVSTNGQGGEGYFDDGWLVFTSGEFAYLPRQTIKTYSNNVIELWQPLPKLATVGVSILATAGCAKVFNGTRSCTHYNNTDNYGGEKDLAGTDRLLNGGNV